MHIVQIPRRFVRHEWGGTETVVLETSRRLPNLGHSTEILCPTALSDVAREDMGGVPVHRVPYFYPYTGLSRGAKAQLDKKGGNLFSFHLMRELMRAPQLDMIHLHTGKRLGGIGRWAAKRRGIPYVISLHGGALDVPAGEAATWTEPTQGAFEWGKILGWGVGARRVMEDADAIVCVGENERRVVAARYPNQRVVYMPNGVDCERFARCADFRSFREKHNIPQQSIVLLTIARIDGQKNQLMAVQALPEILKIEPAAHLLLIGPVTDPAYRERVEQEARTLGVADRLTLIPGLDPAGEELVAAYHAADLFLLPSLHEPFGIAILEAWAACLPVIASRVGGVPFLVRDGEDGLLFDPTQGPSALAEAFARYHQMSFERALSMAAQGRDRAFAEFDWNQVTARLVGLYEEVAEEARKHRPAGRHTNSSTLVSTTVS